MKLFPRHNLGVSASVLIIVLWVAFGLVALTLYFANAMSLELRAADNRVAGLEAEQAIEGAARYVSNALAAVQEPGLPPDPAYFYCEAVPVGDATFWLIGRDTNDWASTSSRPGFGLVDEAAKLNLNTVTASMLQNLSFMTPEFAAAIVDWRDSNSDVSSNGAEEETYARLNPPYHCKNAPFESVEELRLVYNPDRTRAFSYLFGEDANLNGALDPNENDGEILRPSDNRDGRLDPGLFEYTTAWSRQPALGTNVNDRQNLAVLLGEYLGTQRANQILAILGPPQTQIRSVLEFYLRSQMSAEEFQQVEPLLTASTNQFTEGLVNVNTASEAVLACIPGIGIENAGSLVAQRQSQVGQPGSIAWVKDVLTPENAIQAGPYLTGRSYQFSADIVAVGRFERGYQRVRLVFDTSEGVPKVIYRRDLTHLGWALGSEVRLERQQLLALRRR